jgi:hypothetical protein
VPPKLVAAVNASDVVAVELATARKPTAEQSTRLTATPEAFATGLYTRPRARIPAIAHSVS